MIFEWIAYAALCAALVGIAAACVDGVFAALRRARRVVWIVAIGASTLIPLALPLRARGAVTPTSAQAPSSVASSPDALQANEASASSRIDVIVLSVWAAASALFALVLLVAHRRTTIALKSCRTGTIGGNDAFISTDFGPAVVGVLRHHIVVPSWTLALHEDEQRLVVAHELEHARSGDPLLSLAGVCAVVAMPWNAALWWQLSRLRLAIELDCDARVIAQKTGDALSYSRLLLSVGERGRATRQPVLAMSRSRSALAKRFDALLRRDAVRPSRVVGLAALAIGTVASVAFVPAPNMSDVVAALRVRRAPVAAAVSTQPIQTATFSQPTSTPLAGAVTRNTSTSTNTRPRPRTSALDSIKTIPPVSVVPSASTHGPLDSVVVARATIMPMTTRRGGVIMASPSNSAGRGGFSASATPNPVIGADSNRVIRPGGGGGGRGGRAMLVPRPDTTARPPI